MENSPTYKVHGQERKKLKKELSSLKSYVKNFWYYHCLDKDMSSFFGGAGNFPMSDKNAEEILKIAEDKIAVIEEQLSLVKDFGRLDIVVKKRKIKGLIKLHC